MNLTFLLRLCRLCLKPFAATKLVEASGLTTALPLPASSTFARFLNSEEAANGEFHINSRNLSASI
jgi:hypothetical protein